MPTHHRPHLVNGAADALTGDGVGLLRAPINYHSHFLAPGPDGGPHLPATSSPSAAATHATAPTTPIDVRSNGPSPVLRRGDGAIQVPLRKGDSALITAEGDRRDPNGDAPRWGLPGNWAGRVVASSPVHCTTRQEGS